MPEPARRRPTDLGDRRRRRHRRAAARPPPASAAGPRAHRHRHVAAVHRARRPAHAAVASPARPGDDRDAGPRHGHRPHAARRPRRPVGVRRPPGQPPRAAQLLDARPGVPGAGRVGVEPARRRGAAEHDRDRAHDLGRAATRRHRPRGDVRRRPRGARAPLRHHGADRALEPLPAGAVVDAGRRRGVVGPVRRPGHAARRRVRGVLLPADPRLLRHPRRRVRRRPGRVPRRPRRAPARRPARARPPGPLDGPRGRPRRAVVDRPAGRAGHERPREHVDRRRPLRQCRGRSRRDPARHRALRGAPQPVAAARRPAGHTRGDGAGRGADRRLAGRRSRWPGAPCLATGRGARPCCACTP